MQVLQQNKQQSYKSLKCKVLHFIKILLLIISVLFIALTIYTVAKLFLPRSIDLPEISKISGIKFPKSAKVLESRLNGEFMSQFYVKIQMKQADAQLFIKSLPKGSDVLYGKRLLSSNDNGSPSWWDPDSSRKFVSVIIRPESHFQSLALISLDNKNSAILYLYHTR